MAKYILPSQVKQQFYVLKRDSHLRRTGWGKMKRRKRERVDVEEDLVITLRLASFLLFHTFLSLLSSSMMMGQPLSSREQGRIARESVMWTSGRVINDATYGLLDRKSLSNCRSSLSLFRSCVWFRLGELREGNRNHEKGSEFPLSKFHSFLLFLPHFNCSTQQSDTIHLPRVLFQKGERRRTERVTELGSYSVWNCKREEKNDCTGHASSEGGCFSSPSTQIANVNRGTLWSLFVIGECTWMHHKVAHFNPGKEW